MEAQRVARTLLHAEGVSHRRMRHPEVADREPYNAIACGCLVQACTKRSHSAKLSNAFALSINSHRPQSFLMKTKPSVHTTRMSSSGTAMLFQKLCGCRGRHRAQRQTAVHCMTSSAPIHSSGPALMATPFHDDMRAKGRGENTLRENLEKNVGTALHVLLSRQ